MAKIPKDSAIDVVFHADSEYLLVFAVSPTVLELVI